MNRKQAVSKSLNAAAGAQLARLPSRHPQQIFIPPSQSFCHLVEAIQRLHASPQNLLDLVR